MAGFVKGSAGRPSPFLKIMAPTLKFWFEGGVIIYFMSTRRVKAQDKAFPHDWGEGVTRSLLRNLLVTEEGCYLGNNQTICHVPRNIGAFLYYQIFSNLTCRQLLSR